MACGAKLNVNQNNTSERQNDQPTLTVSIGVVAKSGGGTWWWWAAGVLLATTISQNASMTANIITLK
jgi:hypothetical protein